jgi:hypothetical protein
MAASMGGNVWAPLVCLASTWAGRKVLRTFTMGWPPLQLSPYWSRKAALRTAMRGVTIHNVKQTHKKLHQKYWLHA